MWLPIGKQIRKKDFTRSVVFPYTCNLCKLKERNMDENVQGGSNMTGTVCV
jgi:hypothetical protein